MLIFSFFYPLIFLVNYYFSLIVVLLRYIKHRRNGLGSYGGTFNTGHGCLKQICLAGSSSINVRFRTVVIAGPTWLHMRSAVAVEFGIAKRAMSDTNRLCLAPILSSTR